MRILLIEDDRELARQIAAMLEGEHFAVDVHHDGAAGFEAGLDGEHDAVIPDPGLPTMEGFTVLRRWRQAGLTMPVIMLTGSRKEI